VIITVGIGFTQRDPIPEAVTPLFDRIIPDFSELFRARSHEEAGSSTIPSRVLGGMANGTFAFRILGSTNTCRLA
jgi:molybdenum cofactor biosynthesis protein B